MVASSTSSPVKPHPRRRESSCAIAALGLRRVHILSRACKILRATYVRFLGLGRFQTLEARLSPESGLTDCPFIWSPYSHKETISHRDMAHQMALSYKQWQG